MHYKIYNNLYGAAELSIALDLSNICVKDIKIEHQLTYTLYIMYTHIII